MKLLMMSASLSTKKLKKPVIPKLSHLKNEPSCNSIKVTFARISTLQHI